jgi:hypothetical protein
VRFGPSEQLPTISDTHDKVRVIQDRVIVAGTGQVGMGNDSPGNWKGSGTNEPGLSRLLSKDKGVRMPHGEQRLRPSAVPR